MNRPDRCTSDDCQSPLLWTLTFTGNWLPLDAEPSPRGNVQIATEHTLLGPRTQGRVLGPDAAKAAREDGIPLYLSHFASCPEPWRFRR